ncbi:MAG: DUF5063 domain-containing protein [Bacteroidaceae bacterium]|nr:DUF5063 domain-containing protein [Bacteroidaceae bacterium]
MDIVYSAKVVEFVTVGAEYCAYLEQSEGRDKDSFINTLLKLLPLLYLKASLLPKVEGNDFFGTSTFVSEEDYYWLKGVVAGVMGNDDEYEDLMCDEQMQTDEVRLKSVSEDLADIYQPVRDFVETFRTGVEDIIAEALWTLNDSFELTWGGNLVDVLRRLHRVKYILGNNEETI